MSYLLIIQTSYKIDNCPALGSNGVTLCRAPSLPADSYETAGNLIITSAIISLLEELHCIDNISPMVFDTTSSNTGM